MTKLAVILLHTALCLAPLVAQTGVWRVIADDDVARSTLAAVERLLPQRVAALREHFPGTPSRGFSVHLHSRHAAVDGHVDEGTPGFALLDTNQIHLILGEIRASPPQDLPTVLDHELVHILLNEFVGDAAPHVPRWFHEGLAQHLSGDSYLGAREEDLFFDARTDRLLRFSDLRDTFPSDPGARRRAYGQSFSFVSFLVRELGLATIIDIARDCDAEDGYRSAFARRTREPLDGIHRRWVDYLGHGSGARYRILFENCFSYVMIAGVVLLALAGRRRWNRDWKVRQRLEREEAAQVDDQETRR